MRRAVVLHSEIVDPSRADEQDTLVQAGAVARELGRLGCEAQLLPFSRDMAAVIRSLYDLKPDFVFNLVESVNGGSELVPMAAAMLEALGIPHTGSSATALSLQQSKLITKRVLQGESLPTTPWCSAADLGNGRFAPGQVYIVKSVWEHCSLGMDDASVICLKSREQARGVLASRQQDFGGEFFVERFVDGREFNLALISNGGGPKVLPPAEMLFENYPQGKPRIVGFAAKWNDDSFESCHTVRRFRFSEGDGELLSRLNELAAECWRVFGLNGYARVDFRVDAQGRPWILEINANPCISPDAGFVAAAAEAGMDYSQVVGEISRHSG